MSDHLTIDGLSIEFEQGQTIMEAAMAKGVYIPHLCHNPEFKPHGSCRLCVVNCNGRTLPACTSPAVDGMVIENNTKALQTQKIWIFVGFSRRGVVQNARRN